MYPSISVIELLLTLVAGLTALVLYVRGNYRYRWAFAAFVSAAFAAAITPADPFSMLLMFVAFLGFFAFGTRYRITEELGNRASAGAEAIGALRLAVGIALLALCVFVVGRLYSESLVEPVFGYQAFRVWATNLSSIALLVVACAVWLYGLLFRRRRVDRLEHN